MDDETDRQLYEILRADNADELCHLVSEGLGANEADADKNTLLHRAARYRAADCMRVLLAAGADVTARNKYGETPLHEAVDWWSFFRENSGKSATCVDILLKAGADASAMADTWIGTPLDVALKNNHHPEACLLRLAGKQQKSPIMQAVWDANTETLGTLLTQQPGNIGRMLGKKSTVNDTDEFQNTPLHIATLPGRTACLPHLLRAGAKPNITNKEGITPLMLATLMGNAEAVNVLLNAGASTEMADDKNNTPLMHAVRLRYTACVRTLLKAGAKVNHRNHRRDTALHKSAGNADIMQLLIAAGAKLNAEDQNGMTPLAECAHSFDTEKNRACVRLLIAAGADINHPECRGIPPLYWAACSTGSGAMLRLLIESGADVNQCGQSGMTPLHCAAMGNNPEAVRLLLAAGADPTAACAEGRTPRDYAKGKEGKEVRDILADALRARGISLTQGPVMPVKEIRRKLRRKAIVLHSSPVTAPAQELESCLGGVTRQRPGEDWPTDAAGNKLVPLATLCLTGLPALPAALKKVAFITIYAPVNVEMQAGEEITNLGFVLRTYADTADLVPCNHTTQQLTPCLLTPELVKNDMPKNPNCGGNEKLWDNIDETERALELAYWEDIMEADYEVHKIGGYPTYAQEEPEIPGGYSFVLQICTDTTAGLSIWDDGNYYFYYNSRKKAWLVHTDSC